MRLLLFVVLLASCSEVPTAATINTDQTVGAGTPGQLPAFDPCWQDSSTAPLAGFPWCGKKS